MIYILKWIVQGTQKCIEILVGRAVFKLWIKTVKIIVLINDSRTPRPT